MSPANQGSCEFRLKAKHSSILALTFYSDKETRRVFEMTSTKFISFERILVACVISILLIGFVSISWAKKPSQPPSYHPEYGYAMLDDSMAIQSDGGGQYTDCTKGGEDFVQVEIYYDDSGKFRTIDVVLGRMEYFHPGEPVSTRRVNLCFDVLGSKIPENYVDNEAVYDILKQYKDSSGNYQDRNDNPLTNFIDDKSVHAEIYANETGAAVINFVVDPGSDCLSDKAIDDKRVNDFYTWDDPNLNYKDTAEAEYGGVEAGQIFYSLSYANGFNVVQSGRTWEITPKDGEVKLSVRKYRGPSSNGACRRIYLATYTSVPFKLTVSLDPLAGGSNQAPRRHGTVSTTWGEIKSN